MAVGRGAARIAALFVVLAGVVATAATPAAAEGQDRVGIRAPGSFTAGGSAGSVNVSVTSRTKGCVIVRTALGIELAGLTAEQVQVEVAIGGQWQPVGVSGGGAGVTTGTTQPERPMLCDKRSVTVRYRVTFLAGAPGGTATLIGQAGTAAGQMIGSASDTSRVVGGRATRTPSASPEPPVATEEPPTAAQSTGTPLAAVGATPASDGGGLGFGWVVILLGMGMVGLGVALLVVLLRRNRAGAEGAVAGVPVPAGPFPAAPGPFPAQTQAFPAQTQAFPVETQAFPAETRPFPPAAPSGDATTILPRFPHQP